MLDRVTHRKDLRDELVSILRMLGGMPAPTKGDLPAPAPARIEPSAEAPAQVETAEPATKGKTDK